MDLEVRHLRVLVAVADQGSITKAAALLGLSQPSLTAQVQRIERTMGEAVFVRSRAGVVTTPYGRGLITRARTVLREMDDLLVSSLPAPRDEIVLGDAGLLLSAVVPRLERELPAGFAVRAHIDPAASALVAMLRTGRLDAAIVSDVIDFETPVGPGVDRVTVVPLEPVFVAVSERHPLARRPVIDLADLADESWIVNPHDNPGWLASLRAACARLGFEPKVAFESSHMAGARAFVGTGRCVAIADPLSVEGMGVAFRPLVGDPVRGRIDLAWVQPCPVPPELLRSVITEEYRRMVGRSDSYQRWWTERGLVLA
ncbi:LysR family transcriptional regulator [Actinokineospora sp. NBRC 105648]|uniref:LysR substrate-binding domain-containing protein n=1 Tax=Actinokineospora sp. NBRC 105648 TaxID=3032206 RepID=UPI002553D6BE|nr:LysR family transcriptional regulator [Actinokineospora sp. NBRC 105648]